MTGGRKNKRKRKASQTEPAQKRSNSDRFGGWVAIATITSFVIGLLTFWGSAQRAEVQARIVGVMDGRLQPNQPLTFIVEVENAGETAGFITRGVMRFCHAKEGGFKLPPQPQYDVAEVSNLMFDTILPGEIATGLSILPLKLNASELKDLQAARGRLWVYGQITYRDRYSLFLGSRKSGFCFSYRADAGGIGICGSEAKNYVYMK